MYLSSPCRFAFRHTHLFSPMSNDRGLDPVVEGQSLLIFCRASMAQSFSPSAFLALNSLGVQACIIYSCLGGHEVSQQGIIRMRSS